MILQGLSRLLPFAKAMEWGDKIPTGILYIEDDQSYVEKVPFLKEVPLVDLPVETEVIEGFFKEFM